MGRGTNPNSHVIMKNGGGKGRQPSKLNRYQQEDLITKTIGWIADGVSKEQVKKLIESNAPVKLLYRDVYKIITGAISLLEERGKQDVATTVSTHMQHYEDLYAYFERIDHAAGKNKVMKQKEKLAGIYRGSKKLTINNNVKTVIQKEVPLDTSKLNSQQQERFNELLQKVKS